MAPTDLREFIGRQFGRLTIVGPADKDRHGRTCVRCVCTCGNEKRVALTEVKRGRVASCGCLNRELSAVRARAINFKHGWHGTPTYHSWKAMVGRCTDPRHVSFPRYGGKGVTVHPAWLEFEPFLAAMGERPDWANGGIDRIDGTAPYEPGNCRWATRSQQERNKMR